MNKVWFLLIILSSLLITAGVFIFWASRGVRREGHHDKQKFWSHPDVKSMDGLRSGDEFTLLSWNLAFAHGKGSEGIGYVQKSEKEYQNALTQISQVINENDANIVFLQEVDFAAARTYYLNQAQLISAQSVFSDIAPVTSWKLRYLPYPGSVFNRNSHFGKISSGGAILSRYRLEKHAYDLLPKPDSNSWIYNLFYISRYLQKVELKLGGEAKSMINLHLEAFDIPNRKKQITKLLEKVKSDKPLLVAGDFNTFDITSQDQHVFGIDDYRGDDSFNYLVDKLPESYSEALSDELEFLGTFPARSPNRRLDYIFYDKNRLELLDAKVIQLDSAISDHLPIKARFRVR